VINEHAVQYNVKPIGTFKPKQNAANDKLIHEIAPKNMANTNNICTKWLVEWQWHFKVKKFKVMHFGRNNIRFQSSMKGISRDAVMDEKDLGVATSRDFKVFNQCISYKNTWIH